MGIFAGEAGLLGAWFHFSDTLLACGVLSLLGVPAAAAQTTQDDQTLGPFRLPTITVTARKEPEDVQDLPASVTAVTKEMLENADIRSISEAAQFAPNAFFTEFTARKLSNARFRGIGASPNNPSVTTYIDGVPQLNANSSSIELLDVDQAEFVRGPQSALFGRNTLGGLINVTTGRPSLQDWSGRLIGPFGNFDLRDVRATASGPLIVDKLAVGVGFGYAGRDGFTRNDGTDHDLDSRSAVFGKGQLLWTPSANWEVRTIMTGERARDGDYALNDLGALRENPFHASRDFEGFTHRDVVAPTVSIRHEGNRLHVSTITGFVWWKTQDRTDLDYTGLPLVTRENEERDFQFTQELRLASATNAPISWSDDISLRWQAGVFVFTQNYEQDALNSFAPFVLSQFVAFPVDQHSPQATLDDRGVGVYGQGTVTFREKLDASVGVRADYENKHAVLNTFFAPVIAPPTSVQVERDFTDVSPQFTLAYRMVPGKTVYASAARGFKAGGFNAASPGGSDAYGEEHTWNYEAGVKTTWLGERLSVNGAVFYINWRDLQVNVPNFPVPGQFYIANAGGATSKGVELELSARPIAGLDLFGALGYTDARFSSGSVSNGASVGGNELSNTPDFTAHLGVHYSKIVSQAVTVYGRAEAVAYGDYRYDDQNTAAQDAYSLANFRAGIGLERLFVEGWIRNAFDTRYVPTAFAFPGLAPSGFIGESGAPRTFGIRAGLTF